MCIFAALLSAVICIPGLSVRLSVRHIVVYNINRKRPKRMRSSANGFQGHVLFKGEYLNNGAFYKVTIEH